MKYAIVDIETTGLYHQAHGITEIAVVHLVDGQSQMAFHSLIDPCRNIPPAISALTGIQAKDVHDAPQFEDIIEPLKAALEGYVFVAHNVNFDYQFLKAAFEAHGEPFRYPRLCTMRFSRKLNTGLKSHRLNSVCNYLGIRNIEEHRAGGDALATANVLAALLAKDDAGISLELLKHNSRHAVLPPALGAEQVNALPASPGVYYFFGEGSRPIYIGKAKNLKRRVLSHFTSSGSTRRKQLFQKEVVRLDFMPTLNEYEALLLEDAEIKKWWPKYNQAQKERAKGFAIVPYRDRKNAQRLAIIATLHRPDALAWFLSLSSAKAWLGRALISEGISPARAGLYTPEEFIAGAAADEDRALASFIAIHKDLVDASYLLVSSAANGSEALCVSISHGKYSGFGTLSDAHAMTAEDVEAYIRPAPDSVAARSVIRKMLNDPSIQKYAS